MKPIKDLAILCLVSLCFIGSCTEEEGPEICTFSFKGKEYKSRDVSCFDQKAPTVYMGPGMLITAKASWGSISIEQRYSILAQEDPLIRLSINVEGFPPYESDTDLNFKRTGITLEFTSTMIQDKEGFIDTGPDREMHLQVNLV